MGRRALGPSNTRCFKFWLSGGGGGGVAGSSLLCSHKLNLNGGRKLSVLSVWALGALLWQNRDSGFEKICPLRNPIFSLQSRYNFWNLRVEIPDVQHPLKAFLYLHNRLDFSQSKGFGGAPTGEPGQRDSVLRTPVCLWAICLQYNPKECARALSDLCSCPFQVIFAQTLDQWFLLRFLGVKWLFWESEESSFSFRKGTRIQRCK